jgi:hypothetical protein
MDHIAFVLGGMLLVCIVALFVVILALMKEKRKNAELDLRLHKHRQDILKMLGSLIVVGNSAKFRKFGESDKYTQAVVDTALIILQSTVNYLRRGHKITAKEATRSGLQSSWLDSDELVVLLTGHEKEFWKEDRSTKSQVGKVIEVKFGEKK